ncbi:Plastocyanin [Halomicrobium zhouii]|uniref:Plastocyanin n=1 Tax=Halomicrobium zhouii TaxID=767519 RepID=A0A1I6KBM3_9EURY|nr:plastocyanin/azurin family copper-binding protein [Halomicrobium zhouii]SFR88418.1 Plastocyanin [Halomicrobium zhouii]
MRRRTLLGTIAGSSLAGLAGCSSDGDDGSGGDGGDGSGDDSGDGGAEGNEVAVAPGGSLTFSPETISVSTGTTVTWTFESPTHNVSCNPDHDSAGAVSLPEDAEPFASYEGDDRFATNEEGETFEHTFEVEGTYDYVCVPHVTSGMVGTVEVE